MAEAWKIYLRLLRRFPDRLPDAVALDDVLTFMAAEVAQQMDIVSRRGEVWTRVVGECTDCNTGTQGSRNSAIRSAGCDFLLIFNIKPSM